MRRCVRGPVAGSLAWVCGVAGCGGPVTPPVEAVSPVAAREAAVAVSPESGATAVAVALVLPGSGVEDGGNSGSTLLAARALVEEARPLLAGLGAEARVECGRWAVVLTLLAVPEEWRTAAALVASVLERGAVSEGALERARSGMAASLALDRASPAWQARLAAGRALYGPGSPWAVPACGVLEALPLFDRWVVEGEAARLGSVWAIAGAGALAESDTAYLAGLFRPARVTSALPVPAAPEPGRVYVERNTVTAWVTLSWPFGRDADAEAVGLVGALLVDAVGPGLARPGILHAESELDLHGRGGSLAVTLVVLPEEAEVLAEALEVELARLAGGRVDGGVLERVARRYRGERLLGLATPEARAARMARALARGWPAGPWPLRSSMGAEAVREAAAGLGPPARSVVGPRDARGAAVP